MDPINSERQACGRTSRGQTGGRSHRISPPSFCGACLNFYRGKIQSSLSLVDCDRKHPVRVTVPRFELTSQRQKVSRLPTEPPGRPGEYIVEKNL